MSQKPRPLYPGRSARDFFGAELRHWRMRRGLSLTELAALVHFSSDLIAKIEKAERWPQQDLTDACDGVLDAGGTLSRLWPWVETEHQYALAHADNAGADADIVPARAGFGMRKADSVGFSRGVMPHTGRQRGRSRPAVADSGAPQTLEAQVAMSADESAWLFDHPTNVGPAGLDQLRSNTTRLARMFANEPRIRVFSHARWLRDQAFALLDGRQRVSESRELYWLAGAVCGMLSDVTEDLGYLDAAMTHARTGLMCAQQSGHSGLTAWIHAQQSMISYYGGRYAHAVEYARRGQELNPVGTVAVRLPALEARAAARLGKAETARTALTRAVDARDQVAASDLDEIGGIAAFGQPKQHHYGADTYLSIGDSAAVVAEAEACLAGYWAEPPADRAYDNMASAQINLAQARVGVDLEGARDAVQPAFGLAPELRSSSVRARFRQLHGRLCVPALAAAPVAIDLRGQIEHFLADGTTALPPA